MTSVGLRHHISDSYSFVGYYGVKDAILKIN